jgi:recombination protein RecT
MSQEVAPRRELTPVEQLAAEVRSADVTSQVELALPEGMSPHRFVRAAATALLEREDLVKLDRKSLFTALIRSAQDGLVPDGREAALVPFKGKAVYVPMIHGYRKIAAEHGWSLRARVVYSREPFDFRAGAQPNVFHKPIVTEENRGEMVLAYAIARHRDGRVELDVMTKEEIEKVRKTSKQPDGELWKKWPERAWEKTVGRRLFKQLPLDERDKERIDRMLRADELDAGEAEGLVYGGTIRGGAHVIVDPNAEPGTIEARQALPSRGETGEATGAATGAPAASQTEPEDSEPQPTSGSAPLFQGEEPPAAGEVEQTRNDADVKLALVLPDAFLEYAGKTIGEIASAGDKRYLKWLATEVNDEAIREAAKQGLAELSG